MRHLLDPAYVDAALSEIQRAITQGGAHGCKHAFQVLQSLKAHVHISQIDDTERAVLGQLISRVRDGAREDGNEVMLSALLDLERMTVQEGGMGAVGGTVGGELGGDEEQEDTMMKADGQGEAPMEDMDASVATVVCGACGGVILESRWEAHVQFWCRGGDR